MKQVLTEQKEDSLPRVDGVFSWHVEKRTK